MKLTDKEILVPVLETLAEAGSAPRGVLYAALSSQGVGLVQFGRVITALKDAGCIQTTHDVVSLTQAGLVAASNIKAMLSARAQNV